MSMLQQIINNIYRYPKANLERYKRFGGYLEYRRMLAAEADMKKAAEMLPPRPSFSDGLPVYFLTGQRYYHQTLFCIHSLCLVSFARFRFVLIDDGTFDDKLMKVITRQLPGVELISSATLEHNLDARLPAAKYSYLRNRRTVYPHLRKLTDIHTLPVDGWKLVLDSDMLFWQEPVELIHWLSAPRLPLYMLDEVESYGYRRELMAQLAEDDIPRKLNVGVIGLASDRIDWDRLEQWIMHLEQAQGTSYFLEQALTTMLIGSQPCVVLDRDRYQVNPVTGNASGVLKHYVDLSKKDYFKNAWYQL